MNQTEKNRQAEERGLLLFFAVGAGLFAFMMLARLAGGPSPAAFDTGILTALRTPGDLADPIGDAHVLEAMRDVTALGGWPVLTLMVTLVAVFLILRGHLQSTALLVAAGVGQSIAVSQLKALFSRERPSIVPHLVESSNYSFPSGHSASAAAIYLTLAVLLARESEKTGERMFVYSAAVFLVVAIGFSRIYLGVHYPTDVLAGWAFGAAWAGLVLIVARRFKNG